MITIITITIRPSMIIMTKVISDRLLLLLLSLLGPTITITFTIMRHDNDKDNVYEYKV